MRIVTHHERPKAAADLWAKEGVAAVGWASVGDLQGKNYEQIKTILMKKQNYAEYHAANAASQLLAFRDKVEKGNIVIAYQRKNIVALVGTVVRKYKFNEANRIGDPEGEFDYPQQIEVDWRPKPRGFPRTLLPGLAECLARRGTIAFCDYDVDSLEKALSRI